MGSSRFLNPTAPGGLLSQINGLLTAGQALVVQAITSGTYFHFNETPTGSINGVNTTFTLAAAPLPTGSLEVYVNGQLQQLTTDYTLSSTTLTLLVAIPTGSILTVSYTVSPV